jgi:heme exporter protein B
VLLPILLFPVAIPVLIAAVKGSQGFLTGAAMADISVWLNLLIVFDVLYFALPLIIFDFVVEE